MRSRCLMLLALLLLAAACGQGVAADAGGSLLHYAYRPGETLSYEMELVTGITSRSVEGTSAPGSRDWSMDMRVTGRLDLAFSEGADPATIRIAMTQEVIDGEATMTADGQEQSIPLDQFTAGLQNEVAVVIDPQGKLLSASIGGAELPAQFLTALSGLSGSTTLQPQQLGPEFPAGPLRVGDEWQTTASADVLGLSITQAGRHRLAAEEQLLGRTTYRIESRVTTGPYSADLAGLLDALREAPALFGGADPEQLEAAFGQFADLGIALEFAMAESTASLTTWFDPAAGIVVRSELETPITLTLQMTGTPGAGDGTTVIEMSTSQRLSLAS